VRALRESIDAWETGDFSWTDWDASGGASRSAFAQLLGVPSKSVALLNSVAEAAALVGASLTAGRVVVGANEFRSNLLPWLSLERSGWTVTKAPGTAGAVTTDSLLSAIDDRTTLVAASEVLSFSGSRLDVVALARRCQEVGARLFLDLTQSFGVLPFDADLVAADFVAVHGYKWLIAPRGCAWLHVRDEAIDDLVPLAPGWKAVSEPYAQYFGVPTSLPAGARKLDASTAWLPWTGALPALNMALALNRSDVEKRALDLAAEFRTKVRRLGLVVAPVEGESQIVVVQLPYSDRVVAALAAHRVKATVRPGALRVGFHGFNTAADLDALIEAISDGIGGGATT
jgi:selenocysteine lyase/cysteine desulfurase